MSHKLKHSRTGSDLFLKRTEEMTFYPSESEVLDEKYPNPVIICQKNKNELNFNIQVKHLEQNEKIKICWHRIRNQLQALKGFRSFEVRLWKAGKKHKK